MDVSELKSCILDLCHGTPEIGILLQCKVIADLFCGCKMSERAHDFDVFQGFEVFEQSVEGLTGQNSYAVHSGVYLDLHLSCFALFFSGGIDG